ncbi:MAG: S-layer homology domain-containing protein, partial [Lachnospiraceae bacterium]|nr:S-layer homology domain-containing protein [Lachnospiraceae bacterium]
GTYTLTFSYAKDSSADSGSDIGWFSGLSIAFPVASVDITATISSTGEVVVAQEPLTVVDLNDDGVCSIHEALVAAHDEFYEGGAAAGYATGMTQYGTSITKFWGTETFSAMYWINDAMGYSLDQALAAGDYLNAYTMADLEGYSDAYALFDSHSYAAEEGQAVNVTLNYWWGQNEDYTQNIFRPLTGAAIAVLDSEGHAVSEDVYTVTETGNGAYSIAFTEGGEYTLVATGRYAEGQWYPDGGVIVPAVAKVTYTVVPSATVSVIGQSEKNTILRVDGQLAVLSGLEVEGTASDEYGYTEPAGMENAVTALDALIELHAALYGDAFAADPTAYLQVNSAGTIQKIFGVETTMVLFHVNDLYPTYPDQPGTGSTVADTAIHDDDTVRFWRPYSDYDGMFDSYLTFDAASYDLYSDGEGSFEVEVMVKDALMGMQGWTPLSWEPAEDAMVCLMDQNDEIVTAAPVDEDGIAEIEFDDSMVTGQYYLVVGEYENMYEADSFSTPYAVVNVYATPAPADIAMTITDGEGNVPVALQTVTVSDVNHNYMLDVDDALYAVHEQFYEGGAAAGYATAQTQWGASISKLWGDDCGSYGYYLNNAACWSLADPIAAGDTLAAFVYQDSVGWSDVYAWFDEFGYTAAPQAPIDVMLSVVGWDENWNAVTQEFTGADIALYNMDMTAVDAAQYTAEEVGEGHYTLTLPAGTYYLIATAADRLTVPAVAKVTVTPSPENVYIATGDFLERIGAGEPGLTAGAEWVVLGLARSDRDIPLSYYSDYYDDAAAYVAAHINDAERLHRNKSTDNARMILALTAIGADVTDVAGHDLLAGLNEMSYLMRQGINGPIWALLAFDSGNYATPETGDVTREALVAQILSSRLADGGWALGGTVSDVDMTAMAIQSLAPYYETNADVKTAVDEALAWLSAHQNDDGGFSASGYQNAGPSSESTAQVIVALGALGLDADEDERFVKNGNSPVDALCTYFVSDDKYVGFAHTPDGTWDGMATEQAYYALVDYFRAENDRNSLYDMTDVTIVSVPVPEAAIEGDEMVVSWDAVTAEIPGSTITYAVEYRVGDEEWLVSDATADTTIAISELPMAGEYEVRVRLLVDGGAYLAGDAATCVYDPAFEVKADRGNDSEVIVSWLPIEGVDTYRIIWSPDGETWVKVGDFTGSSATLTGGKYGTVYQIMVMALNESGKTKAFAETSVRTHFSDVTDNTQFYYDPVYWAADNGITTGWADGTFRPWNTCNRAAVVTFLWRTAGCPEPTGEYTFSDPTGNADFDKAITWAVEQGITTGWADNTFRPWNTCNRAAIVTFLWRYAGKPAPAEGYEVTFTDMTGNADFDAAITWAASYGVATGNSATTFNPWGNCNRAATVTFLYRLTHLD